MLDFLETPNRASKPRQRGITHALDSGTGIQQARDRLAVCEEFVDIVKLGWGTGYVTDRLERKVDLYHDHGIPVYFGGTLFEIAVMQDEVGAYVETMKELGIDHVEVSTGVIEMDHDRKCQYVSDLSEEFTVLSEIGRKDSEEALSPEQWRERAQRERAAGAWKVITEGRAGGETGVYDDDGAVRSALLEAIEASVGSEALLFEAPRKEQQAWFVNQFGPSVNLGNVRLDDVIPVETLRRGLRGDTMDTIQTDERERDRTAREPDETAVPVVIDDA